MHEHPPAPIVVNMSARVASSPSDSSACDNTARAVYSSKFYDEVARIQREMDEEDAGIVKPSRGERPLASQTQAYYHSDYKAVQCVDKLIEKNQVRLRAASACKKQRKADSRNYVAELGKNRTADPPSDKGRS